MTVQIDLTNIIAPSFYGVHWSLKENEYTHYWLDGGRGSTKSSFISVEIPLGMMNDPNANAVVLRKVKDTLKDSVYEQLCWGIEALGVDHLWHRSISPLELTYKPTGQKIKFRGADKPKKIKSIKFAKGYCKYIWYEELDEFTGMQEIRTINQSLMRGGQSFVCFYSYNPPKSKNNWVNAEALATRKDRLRHHSDYRTVPVEWLGPQFIIEAEHLKVTNLDAYEHEYLGIATGTGGEVFKNIQIREITDEEIKEFWNVARGLDFGYAVDPCAYVVNHYDRKKKTLYIFHESRGVGVSNHSLYKSISEENKDNEIVNADSAEPRTINELRQYGLRIHPVKKGPDSVKYGIKWLQSLEAIVIDDIRCPETKEEFCNYELEKDVNGKFKDNFPDKDNHSIDATRYSRNDDCLRFKDKDKKESDPYEKTPNEKRIEARRKMTGGKAPKGMTKW